MKTIYMKPMKITVIALSLFVAACGGKKSKADQLKEKEKELVALTREVETLRKEVMATSKDSSAANAKTVVAMPVKTTPFVHSIDVLGKVDSDENVRIGAEMGGNATSVNVQVGDKVTKGQLLAQTDNAAMIQGLEEIKSQRAFANTLYEKQERLWKQNIGSEVQYLSAKNNVDALDKRLATLNQQIAMSQLRSPINGVVDMVDVKPGQMLVPGMPVIGIVNKNKLKLQSELAESYISKVKKGNTVLVNIPDANLQFETTIKYTGQAINALNRTFIVEMPIDKKYFDQLTPNMIAKISIVDYENKNAVALPVGVIQKDKKNKYVFVAETNGKKTIAVKRIVQTGQTHNGKVEITEGLKEGDKVITIGYQSLQENDQINIGK
jgi:membrane fusion protein (multidrug efflux system)